MSESKAGTQRIRSTGTGIVAGYPLTPMQLGMLVDSNLSDRPWVNVEQIVCHLDDEPIDVEALRAAWTYVQDEHEILRTSFFLGHDGDAHRDRIGDGGDNDNGKDHDGDEPRQLLHESVPVTITVHDRRSLTAIERDVALREWLIADRNRGIDVSSAPAMRLTLFVDGPHCGVLVWTVHHALVDGRGFTLVLQDAFDAYEQILAGTPLVSRSARPRFADHVAAVLATDRRAAEAHFRGVLSGYDEPVDMAGALGNLGAVRTAGRHREIDRHIPAATIERLANRAGSSGATLSTAVMAAWALLLARSTYRDDVVFGATRAGRHTIPDADELAGCLITSVPVRAHVGADETVDDLFAAIRGQQDAVRPHEHASLVDIHRWSDVPPTVPLYTTGVVFERSLVDSALRSRGGRWAARRFDVLEESGLPLFLAAYEDDGLLLRLEYDTVRFSDATAERLADQLVALLDGLSGAAPNAMLGTIPMLSPNETAAVVDGLNPPRYTRPNETILDRLERVAENTPSSPALSVAGSGIAITYRDFDRRANQLATMLRDHGARPDRIVAICLPRSPEFVIATLAVMKTGAAYLPIDPAYPAEAIEHMLADADPCAVVTTTGLRERVSSTAAGIIDVDGDKATIDTRPDTAPDRSALDSDHPAYVIYTSGSSGRPKGVLISHGALAAFCDATSQRYEIRSSDRILQFASLSFDISIEEIFPTLVCGACLVLRTDAMAESIDELLDVTSRDGLTVLNLPTAFWHDVVEHLDTNRASAIPDSVRLSIVGGEKVNRHAYDRWADLVPGVRWMNGYGPTEATVTSTLFDPAEHPAALSGTEVPIGVPLVNTRVYILGPDRSIIPKGVAGQMWIGGASVATGYHNRPDLTAERFLADPFDDHAGARMYATGDLARWLDTGDVEFLGRTDRQVKVRGFRIEPAEVEANLERQRDIAMAFVAVRGDVTGDALVAWVTPKPGATVDAEAVRRAMRTTSASHMVPSAIVVVDELPLTPGGKVDLGALPAPPSRSENLEARALDEPDDDTERSLCDTFAGVLRLDQFGVNESFFELGGHSLLAVRLLGRLRRDLGHHVSLSTLYGAPTPRELAAEIRSGHTDGYSHLIPIKPSGSLTPIFGVHVLGTNAAYYRPLAARLDADRPLYGLSFSELDEDTPTDIATIAATYAVELERFRPTGPIVIAAVSLGGYVAFDLAQQLVAKGRHVAVLAVFDGAGPGGRPKASRARRLRIHLRQIRHGRLRYLRTKVRGVTERIATSAGALRARVRAATGRTLPDALRRHAFVQANVVAADAYAASPYPGRITVFRATGELFDAPEVARTGLGWSVVAGGGIDVVDVPGDHMSIFDEPFVATLAGELDTVVRSACHEPDAKPRSSAVSSGS